MTEVTIYSIIKKSLKSCNIFLQCSGGEGGIFKVPALAVQNLQSSRAGARVIFTRHHVNYIHTRGVRWRDFLPSRSLYSPPRPLILYYCTMVGGGVTSLLVQSPPPFTLILVRVLATMVFIPRRSSSSASLATLEVPLVNNAVMREKCLVSRSASQICWSS